MMKAVRSVLQWPLQKFIILHRFSLVKQNAREKLASVTIGCITNYKDMVYPQTVNGYWERFEICSKETVWVMAFYMKSPHQYDSLKRKCPSDSDSFVQPLTVKPLISTFNAIRIGADFMPGQFNIYYDRGTKGDLYNKIYRITIKQRWQVRDLYQFCNYGSWKIVCFFILYVINCIFTL